MSVERYAKDDDGFRKYVELMETTPTKKRQKFLDAAKAENEKFATTVEKYILTFDRITKLPEMELAEVLGADGLKPEAIANAISSVPDAAERERLVKMIPRKYAPQIQLQMKDFPNPKPEQIGASRLQVIQMARELEKSGKLKSVQIPFFGVGFFSRKSAA